MVGFWIRAGKTIVGTKPFKKFKGQKSKEDILQINLLKILKRKLTRIYFNYGKPKI